VYCSSRTHNNGSWYAKMKQVQLSLHGCLIGVENGICKCEVMRIPIVLSKAFVVDEGDGLP